MIEMVNGYVCRDCSDVALAKRNIDPAHPKDDPNAVNKADATQRDNAVSFGGNLTPGSKLDPTRVNEATTAQQADDGQRRAGAALDIYA
ncbi:MAG: hypothetical protein GC190_02760 [Alphaproteobacteria bacterium]|nr:hypothetical protein [Alphaproteobacteria bacterium]